MIKLSGPSLSKYDPVSEIALDLNQSVKRLANKDSDLWGPNTEAATRLNWIDLPISSRDLLPQLDALSAWARANDLDQIVLCGMGGSSLAPEVIAKSFKKKLIVLDSTDPQQIKDGTPTQLNKTLVVVGSKSGSTIETASQRAYFTELFIEANLDPKNHIVIITDPGSPLDQQAKSEGYRTVNADPNVGGRYSALSAFGLTPAALMGIDASTLIDDAAGTVGEFTLPNSTVVQVATLIMQESDQCIAFFDSNSNVPGLADWIEQLIAESTGKNEKGRLPIVLEDEQSEVAGPALRIGFALSSAELVVTGTLGEHFIFWEYVTALLGRSLKVDPFDQPNVTEAKDRTNELLKLWGNLPIPQLTPQFADEELEIFSTFEGDSAEQLLLKFLEPESKYIAVMAYLNRSQDQEIARVRAILAEKTKRAVSFGWGPRFLHSTGQFHKGGQPNGQFIQITGDSKFDIAIPKKNISFQKLIMAQALGDGQALESRNFPLLRIHLKNRELGITKLLALLKKI